MTESHGQTIAAVPTVMIVDDEEMVTASISALISMELEYRTVAFQSPRLALDHLHRQPVDMIISDFLMPEMNGLEFLDHARKLYPDVPRVILTGYADKENAIRAINEVGLYHYLEKPWDNDHLTVLVRNGVHQKNLHETLRDHIRRLERAQRRADELSETADRLRDELELARRLQRRLMPDRLPADGSVSVAVHYEPAMEIGGDFYDIIELAGNRMGVLVGDVTGHGIQAALSTALLKFAFAQFAGRDVRPCEILSGINDVLYTALPDGIFAAAVVVAIDRVSGRCHIANAGTPHPMVLRRHFAKCERLPAEGLLLGVADPKAFRPGQEHGIDLQPGDGLLLYTDGLTECENGDGEMFEQRAFGAALAKNIPRRGNELLDEIVASVRTFRNGRMAEDDLTALVIEMIEDRSAE
ncbi:MAG: SpoIIE family protein phosphatase [candidate division Zixibacteria bacterium]|jgi:serine phosphatase RsbU (regulator of sigma subunit)|nr:SpoIIE family protein phosphatase [candidate division Zixibacteria bacterium]